MKTILNFQDIIITVQKFKTRIKLCPGKLGQDAGGEGGEGTRVRKSVT